MTEEVRRPSRSVAAGTFALAGLVLGTAVGTLLQLTGRVDDIGPVAGGAAAVGLALGLVAGEIDVRRAATRPVLADGYGRPVVRGEPWVKLLPLFVAAAGFLLLVVLATVQQASVWVGFGFLAAFVGAMGFARALWTQGRLALATELMARGERARARALYNRIAGGLFTTRTGRIHAALNLGLTSLLDGDLDAATRWYAQVSRGRAAAFAQVGLALVRTLEGQWQEAEASLAAASTAGRSLQGEVDGVRLLLVLRRDGAKAARELGERLLSPGAGSLFLGALASARAATGDAAGSQELLDSGVSEALLFTGLERLLPELQLGFGDLEG